MVELYVWICEIPINISWDKALQPRLEGSYCGSCWGSCRTCGQKSSPHAPHEYGLNLHPDPRWFSSIVCHGKAYQASHRVPQECAHNQFQHWSNRMYITMLAFEILQIGEFWPDPWTEPDRRGSHHSALHKDVSPPNSTSLLVWKQKAPVPKKQQTKHLSTKMRNA